MKNKVGWVCAQLCPRRSQYDLPCKERHINCMRLLQKFFIYNQTVAKTGMVSNAKQKDYIFILKKCEANYIAAIEGPADMNCI